MHNVLLLWHTVTMGGELAQMVERSLSMREVRGSMPRFSKGQILKGVKCAAPTTDANSNPHLNNELPTLKTGGMIEPMLGFDGQSLTALWLQNYLPRVRIELTTFRWPFHL